MRPSATGIVENMAILVGPDAMRDTRVKLEVIMHRARGSLPDVGGLLDIAQDGKGYLELPRKGLWAFI